MTHRLFLAALAATGGLVTTAILHATVAAADVSATGEDAFTIGNFTFDPYTVNGDGVDVEGFSTIPQFTSAPPLLELGGASALGLTLAPQSFEVFSHSGADLGSIDTGETVTNLFGLTNTEFTVLDASTDSNVPLPAVGSVFDAFNLGSGYTNVYTAIPAGLDGKDTVTDTLITPNGSIDLTPLFGSVDAAAPLAPGNAFTNLQTSADSVIGHDAFTLGGVNWDPQTNGAEGFAPVDSTVGAAPLLNIGGASLGDPVSGGSLVSQDFYTYSVSGETATQTGYVQTGEEVANLLGFTNTQIVVTSGDAFTSGDPTVPTTGSVYDAFNFGSGITNVYSAIPGVDGGADKITDTLITPGGSIDLSSLFANIDAAAPLHPADAFTGLQAGDAGIGADAFTIGGTTFDPTLAAGGEGFDTVYQTIGVPPVLLIGGGTVAAPQFDLTIPLAPQSFNVYDGNLTSDQVGSITTDENVVNLLGSINTEFTVTGVTQTGDGVLPTVGSVYDVFNFGGGYENIYTAIAGVNGAADKVTDTFVTPMGSYSLNPLFDAVPALNPGDAFTGLEAATSAAGATDPFAFLGL